MSVCWCGVCVCVCVSVCSCVANKCMEAAWESFGKSKTIVCAHVERFPYTLTTDTHTQNLLYVHNVHPRDFLKKKLYHHAHTHTHTHTHTHCSSLSLSRHPQMVDAIAEEEEDFRDSVCASLSSPPPSSRREIRYLKCQPVPLCPTPPSSTAISTMRSRCSCKMR